MKDFELEIITPEKTIFKDRAHSLIVPAHEGYLGVMCGHAPFVCTLNAGRVTIRQETGDKTITITGGVMETTPNKTTILADAVD